MNWYLFPHEYSVFLDVYSSVPLQPSKPSEKMLRFNKKSFDFFTQRNIRRTLISENHVKQMKLCKDLHHIVNPAGKSRTMFTLYHDAQNLLYHDVKKLVLS